MIYETKIDNRGKFDIIKSEYLIEKPIISVVMSVFNGEDFLIEAIESILNQTYKNFEFIIINDGSEDKSLNIIKQYHALDSRIILINQENIGLTKSLNRGIELSRGEYIVRQDADDISLPDRISKQLSFIKTLSIDILGAQAWVQSGRRLNISPKTADVEGFANAHMMFGNPFVHGTLMFRAKVIKQHTYDEGIKYAQDYELLCRCMSSGVGIAIVPEPLYILRKHNESISNRKSIEQYRIASQIVMKYFGTSRYFMTGKNLVTKVFLHFLKKFYR